MNKLHIIRNTIFSILETILYSVLYYETKTSLQILIVFYGVKCKKIFFTFLNLEKPRDNKAFLKLSLRKYITSEYMYTERENVGTTSIEYCTIVAFFIISNNSKINSKLHTIEWQAINMIIYISFIRSSVHQ